MSVDLVLTGLRVILGLIFVGHGSQKLFGWFGGRGVAGTAEYFGSLGLRPAKILAVLVGLAELLGGLGLVLGVFTPIAALLITAVMLGAIVLVHWPNGFWSQKGGIEYPLLVLITAAALGVIGPGPYAVDPIPGVALPRPESYFYGLVPVILVVMVVVFGRRSATHQRLATG